jgi:uncharacterized phiE125 gp8 family phage protein
MSGRLKLITKPAIEPVTVDDVRLFGRMPDDVDDEAIEPLIASARKAAEEYQGRAYITQTWELVFDSFPACPIQIPKPPLLTLVSVQVTDITGSLTTMTLTDFLVDPSGACGTISLKYGKSWPAVIPERAGVVIRFTCGYGPAASDVPDRVKMAIIFGAVFRHFDTESQLPDAFYRELDDDCIRMV